MGAASGTGQLALMFALGTTLDGGELELGRVSYLRYPAYYPYGIFTLLPLCIPRSRGSSFCRDPSM